MTQQFVAALKAGVAKAKALFGPARMHYESIEPVAESFGNLDPEIDARINDVANVAQWTGFHRIERTLWEQNTTKGTATYADKLMQDVDTLVAKVKTIQLQPAQLANGAVELMNEVANSKITGEEDRYSHTDLSDFEGNLSGSERRSRCSAGAAPDRQRRWRRHDQPRFAAVQRTLTATSAAPPGLRAVHDVGPGRSQDVREARSTRSTSLWRRSPPRSAAREAPRWRSRGRSRRSRRAVADDAAAAPRTRPRRRRSRCWR